MGAAAGGRGVESNGGELSAEEVPTRTIYGASGKDAKEHSAKRWGKGAELCGAGGAFEPARAPSTETRGKGRVAGRGVSRAQCGDGGGDIGNSQGWGSVCAARSGIS